MTVNQTNGYFSRVGAFATCARARPLPDVAKLKIALRLITELIIDDPGERRSRRVL